VIVPVVLISSAKLGRSACLFSQVTSSRKHVIFTVPEPGNGPLCVFKLNGASTFEELSPKGSIASTQALYLRWLLRWRRVAQ